MTTQIKFAYLLPDPLSALFLGDLLVANVCLALGGDDGVSLDRPGWRLLLLLREDWVLANCGVRADVHVLDVVLVDSLPEEGGEVLLVLFRVLLLHFAHVVRYMDTHDAVAVRLGIVVGLLVVSYRVTREPLLTVGDVESTVARSLKGAERLVTGGDNLDTDIEQGLEWPRFVVLLLDVEGFTVGLLLSDELVVEFELREKPACKQEPSAVRRRVVGQSDLDAVVLELG
ncbi:D,D-heptose 1,7-bisphosphate phosphatase, putative [Babesia ovata]|uniref:D,D-heptose 1,7-bisphosphate phosphatase, putative n=1 Tax=Babesia ovata TaxID=189622 RepID=A0A2H6KDD8_9APIC|nr:D,D-heptose 1,7-bisphosphate phosphatase, putative [Babesia ovata]GBE61005.1 D,D-heptose 1,7-bisphosphate phosphatase, putative [Babesia ovata]